MTESEQKAREMWDISGHTVNTLAGDLAFCTHLTFDEIIDELERSIVAAATDILDGETVG